MLHSICQQIWKTQQWPQDWKRSVFIPIPKKGNAKECSNYCTIALISQAAGAARAGKVVLKILQARLQQYVNRELPDVQAGFRKDKGTRDQIANICWIMEKAREFQKNIYFCFIDYAKTFDCVDHNKLENSSRDVNTRAAAAAAAGPPWCREQRLGGSVRRRWLQAPGDSARGTSFYKFAPCVSIS